LFVVNLLLNNFFLINNSYSQKYTISGYVREKETGEELVGASVFIKELTQGAISNQYGFYSMTIEKGEYTLIISFLGFSDYTEKLEVNNLN